MLKKSKYINESTYFALSSAFLKNLFKGCIGLKPEKIEHFSIRKVYFIAKLFGTLKGVFLMIKISML